MCINEKIEQENIPESIKPKIIKMLQDGYSPEEIVQAEPKYEKYRIVIQFLCMRMLLKNKYPQYEDGSPYYRDNYSQWHICTPKITKTVYTELCNKYGKKAIYRCSVDKDNTLESYLDAGAPPVLFVSNYKGTLDYAEFLSFLDEEIAPRWDIGINPSYQFWTTSIITSPLPPEELYLPPQLSPKKEYKKQIESLTAPLLRRLDTITYHYKEDDIDKAFTMPAEDYRDFSDLKRRARRYKDMKFYN